jgi:hypothetical protein
MILSKIKKNKLARKIMFSKTGRKVLQFLETLMGGVGAGGIEIYLKNF